MAKDKLYWSDGNHPVWKLWAGAVFLLFVTVRLAFANKVDGDEFRDMAIVAGVLAPVLTKRKEE